MDYKSKRLARPTHKRPCAACGLKRLRTGEDPCLGHLPGVLNACCGHGVEPGYIQFENFRVLRSAVLMRRDGLRYTDGHYNPSSQAVYDPESRQFFEPQELISRLDKSKKLL